MRRLPLLLVLSVAWTLVPTSAGAMAPKTVPSAIVINKQIGGMRLGMTRTQALRAWGEQGDCQAFEPFDRFCFWSDPDGQASIRFDARTVGSIQLLVKAPSRGGFLREFKLGGGVGLGSTRAQVKQLLKLDPPDGKISVGTSGPSKGTITVTNPGATRSTSFLFTKERLTGIVMQRIAR